MSSVQAIRRKLVIVGDGACGKTSLLCVFAMGEFPTDYEPSAFFLSFTGLYTLYISGQEAYERLRPLSCSEAHVILIAFAIDTPDSLENVTVLWIEEVRSICGPSVPVILVGCKADLRPEDAPHSSTDWLPYVPKARGEQIAAEIGARAYMVTFYLCTFLLELTRLSELFQECSALRTDGVDDVFEVATRASMLVRGDGAGTGHTKRKSIGGSGNGGDTHGEGGGCCVVC
ncbi:hypothetical protein M407DRAFT_27034 [Tulasnella calospora MUT 4182]|uniref:Uncharacterized protein n=1 Tax=Tulasnella calospora MUT 4182 TaxID=1051891 RepID=A0A0C3KQ51_9AGAM|nr:hypothetical protein M407DRAFT_27034 [Tulasnella calospora MUT 4182]